MTESGSASSSIGNGRKLDWPTLALIAITGGGNFLANQQGKNQLSYEQQEALVKIRDLHQGLEEFEVRQKQELEQLGQALKNQQQMLANQQQILEEIRRQK
jgi:hypothetical protein